MGWLVFAAAMKILSVVGNRPQFIKSAPLSVALRNEVDEVVLHTGQHDDRELSQIFFDELDLGDPDYRLEVGSGTHAEQTGRMLPGIEQAILAEAPDAVLVYGDTNSTLAGGLAAAKLGVPVAHVEAGLRSFDRSMPEELNRMLVDDLSSLLFCPSDAAVENLRREGIIEGVRQVGDVMMDANLRLAPLARDRSTRSPRPASSRARTSSSRFTGRPMWSRSLCARSSRRWSRSESRSSFPPTPGPGSPSSRPASTCRGRCAFCPPPGTSTSPRSRPRHGSS